MRQNKAIDRYAFIELLSKIDSYCGISKYKYIGFGGHSFEDFKYIHSRFAINDMTSIEQNKEVHKRQKFNKPHNCINCLLKSSNDFINEFQADKETIIWLDYTTPSQIRFQIDEIQSVVSKLAHSDIVKITLNAHSSSYSTDSHEKRFNTLKNKLGDLFPIADVTSEMMTEAKFPEALCLILKFAIDSSLQGFPDIIFQPLSLFSYRDGQTMLTITGIILEKDKAEDFFGKTNIKNWELSNTNWTKPYSINVPDLTIRERLYIDSLLPNNGVDEIQKSLNSLFHDEEGESPIDFLLSGAEKSEKRC